MLSASFDIPIQKSNKLRNTLEQLQQVFKENGDSFVYTLSDPIIQEFPFEMKDVVSQGDIPDNYKWAQDNKLGVAYVKVYVEWDNKDLGWDVLGLAEGQENGKITYYSYNPQKPIPKEVRLKYDHLKCELCNTIRNRGIAFIIEKKEKEEKEEENYKMIGSKCLEKYIGLKTADQLLGILELAKNPPKVNAIKVDNADQVFMYRTEELLNYQFCKILSNNFSEDGNEVKRAVYAIYNKTSNLKDHKLVKTYVTKENVAKAIPLIENSKKWIHSLDLENTTLYKGKGIDKTYTLEEKENVKILSEQKYINADEIKECIKLAFMYFYNTGKEKEERDKLIAEKQKEIEIANQFKEYLEGLQKEEKVEIKVKNDLFLEVIDPEIEKISPKCFARLEDEGIQKNVVSKDHVYPLIFKGKITQIDWIRPLNAVLHGEGSLENDPVDIAEYNKVRAEKQAKYAAAKARADEIGEVRDEITIKVINVSRESRPSRIPGRFYYSYRAEDEQGGQYNWFSQQDFKDGDIITGNIMEKRGDYSDRNLQIIVLSEVENNPNGTVGERKPGSPLGPIASSAPMIGYKVGDRATFEVRSAVRGTPFKSTKGYDLMEVTFTDTQGQTYKYITTPGSVLDKKLGTIKKVSGTIKKQEGPSFKIGEIVIS